jgi:MFS family permease
VVARSRLLGLGIALALADSSVVTLALPDILRAYDTTIGEVSWVLTSYNLVLAIAAVPAAQLARHRPRSAYAAGAVVFAAASLACAMAPSFGVLVAARAVQAVGGALVVCAALDVLAPTLADDARAVRTWATAGILGAALGPGIGGVLTQTLGWESIFVVQTPLALVTIAALRGASDRAVEEPRTPVAIAPNLALVLVSGALTAALFLLVLLLVDGWTLSPIAAGVVVSVMPLAAIAVGAVAHRLGSVRARASAGAVLVAGGLAALGVLPGADWGWTILPQMLVGTGLGLVLSALTEGALAGRAPQAVHGGWTIAARHAGVVLGLVVLTPVFTGALDRSQQDALRAGAAAVLDSPIPAGSKLSLAQDVLERVSEADGELPDVSAAFADRPDEPVYRELEAALLDELERGVTAAFSLPFRLAAVFALAALVPLAAARRGDA